MVSIFSLYLEEIAKRKGCRVVKRSDPLESPYEKIKGEMRLIERIGLAIPGYRGYKLKELRREADKLVRSHIYRRLGLVRDDLKVVFQRLVDSRVTGAYAEMDRLIARVDAVASNINYASYGYSGFFDAVKIQEQSLDRMLEYDVKLIESVDSIEDKVKKLKTDALRGEYVSVNKHIHEIREAVDALEGLMSERRSIILGVM
jgi:hypothetical protein